MCDIILNLDKTFSSRCRIKMFLFLAQVANVFVVRRSETIYAILVEGLSENISVELFKFGLVVYEEMSFIEKRLCTTHTR